ncbi:MAG TPA: glycine cleavage system protein GcvH [Calditrichae bacterium]|nr:glycine cleavage system protein GcvH [Calditrichia bacterium]
MNIPADLKYSKDHEWARIEGDVAVVGITDYAQNELGDIVYVELPEVGIQVEQGKTFGTIEAVKAVSDLFAPVSGEVVEVNEKLNDSPELVNQDPYGEGWMIKIKMSNPDEVNNLLSKEDYEALL